MGALFEYVVLKREVDGESGFWHFTKRLQATSREAAAQQVALEISEGAGNEIGSGDYLAIPAKSYDPIRIEIEVESKAVIVEHLPA